MFIFIALRALRFEARYVVTAGLFAAAGWVFLAGYALYKSGGTQGVTNTAPDVLMQLLAEYQSRLVPIIQRHGGTIDKFMGDGIMATFGAVAPNPTYAADALRAVEAVLSEAERWRAACDARGIPTCRIGTAVTEGPVIFGAVGDDTRLEYTVIGDAVNVAAKLEKYTKTEGVHALCTAGTYRKAVNQGYRSAADRQQLDGRIIEGLPQPMDVVIIADFQQAQTGSALEIKLLYRTAGIESVFVAHGVRIGVVGTPHVEMLGEDNAPNSVLIRRQ